MTTSKPGFTPDARFELSTGNYDFAQLKGTVTGPLTESLAGRVSFSSTDRNGTLTNIRTGEDVDTLENWSVRSQVLWDTSPETEVRLIAELSRQDPVGYSQVFAGSVPNRRSSYRQFESIIADLGYNPPRDPFARQIDQNTEWRSGNDIGGLSLTIDTEVGSGTLSSTSAWYYSDWRPSNDRDFLGLNALQLSQAPSDHE